MGHRQRRSLSRLLEVGGRAVFILVAWHHGKELFWLDVRHFWLVFRTVSSRHLPYRDFTWEFPPLTILPSLLAVPLRNSLYWFGVAFAAIMAGLEYASLEMLRRARPSERRAVTAAWYTVILPIAAVAYFRLDFLAVLPAVAALGSLDRPVRSGTWAVVGFAAKLWPAALIGVAVAQRRWRLGALTAAGCGAVVLAWWAFSPSGFHAFLTYRKGTGFQIESIVGSLRMLGGATPAFKDGAWVVSGGTWETALGVLLSAAAAAAAVAVVVAAWRRPADPAVLMATLVALFVVSSRIISPQYLAWLLPFVVVIWVSRSAAIGVTFTAVAYLTWAYLVVYNNFVFGSRAVALVVVIRNVLLVALTVMLVRRALEADSAPARPAEAIAARQ